MESSGFTGPKNSTMINITESGEMIERVAVMEGLSTKQSEALYHMYRYILNDINASEFPEGAEMDLLCGVLACPKETTPWLKEQIGKKGFIILTSENYSLLAFDEKEEYNYSLNIGELGYCVYRNEDLEIIPEPKTEQ